MNDKKKTTVKTVLKLLGVLMLLSGAALAVFGFIDFFKSLADGIAPTYFLCSFFGVLLLGVGGVLWIIGFQREVSMHITKEVAPYVATATHSVASAIRTLDEESGEGKCCTKCGVINDVDSKFCKACGNPF